ncbi:acyltransferase [Akkermansiaceae bacterium]|nr:acyltransferase [Akkermansiaceae bacterium]MDB4790224.1 acyltransferase [Akkermansiaceae bacterium]
MIRCLRYEWPLHLVLWVTGFLPDNVIVLRLRGWMAHFFFKSCGKDLRLGRNVTFYNPSNISIGSNVYIAYGNWFSAGDLITIGDQVLLGPYSVYASSNHTSRDGSFRYGSPDKAPISIDSGAWVAANCTVVAGISIGKGALVGAGSVVTKDVPNRVVFAGNPGRVIRPVKG